MRKSSELVRKTDNLWQAKNKPKELFRSTINQKHVQINSEYQNIATAMMMIWYDLMGKGIERLNNNKKAKSFSISGDKIATT